MSFWIPFLPLYLLELGATSEANAIFWIAIGTSAQGISRFISGPIWGVLSDRFGRKVMFLRALYFASATTLIMAVINEPWQLAIAFTCQGIFSGFIPAGVALISVSVPDSRLNSSLSIVTGAQYIGSAVGPALGAILAIAFGYQGAIIAAAVLPATIGTAVIFFVPTDRVQQTRGPAGEKPRLEPFRPNFQFALAILAFFLIFALTQIRSLVTPIALKDLGPEDVKSLVGLTFTLGGLASAISVFFLSRTFFRQGRLRSALVGSTILAGLAHLLMAASGTVPLFVMAFALISLLQAAMVPATNTLIAANISRARRGTAFGVASSAQAVAFMVGPMTAALFTAVSLELGFVVMAGLFCGLGFLILVAMREPVTEQTEADGKSKVTPSP
jgi:DHA1 family multidrug resistance protein-like MFS transporter